ncbi:MAG: ABC transporter permease [Microbacteriaceae bacterium]
MLRLCLNRVLAAIPTLLIVSIGVFLLISLAPGDPAVTLAGPEATREQIAEIRHELGLDRPLVAQYGSWLADAVRLDFGDSLVRGEPIADAILERFPVTFGLALSAALFATMVAMTLGVSAAMRPGGLIDRAARLIATSAIAIPSFWLAPLLVIALAVERRLLPSSGYVPFTESPGQWLRHMAIPAATLGFFMSAYVGRQLRTSLLEVFESGYIRTLWAAGCRHRVVVGHALRNASIPSITVFGVQFGTLLGGSIIIEEIFAIPGLGDYMLRAITAGDIPAVQGATILFALVQVTITILVDLSYGLLNPKVRLA